MDVVDICFRTMNVSVRGGCLLYGMIGGFLTSDVNKDLGLKAKAKAKDSDPKAKAKAKDLSHKAKAKDSDPKAKAKAKDLGPKAKAKDSRYQGPIFHRSSPYIICSSLTLCACFYVRVLHFVSL